MDSYSRFPDGYMRLLSDHQYRAKYTQQQAEEDKLTAKAASRKPSKPDRQIYIAPGKREVPSPVSPVFSEPDLDTEDLSSNEGQTKVTMGSNMLSWTSEDGKRFSVDMDEVDVDSYIEKARPSLRDTIKDPSSVLPRILEDVAACIVNRAWEDKNYHTTAANLCVFIAEKEKDGEKYNTIPAYTFRRCLSVQCSELIDRWDEMRAAKVDWWTGFVTFVAQTFRLLSENDSSMGGLCATMYDVIKALLTPLCLPNTAERELLVLIFEDCGKHLQKQDGSRMTEIVNKLRDLFLDDNSDSDLRDKLLHIIELYAAKWKLSENAELFYNSSKR